MPRYPLSESGLPTNLPIPFLVVQTELFSVGEIGANEYKDVEIFDDRFAGLATDQPCTAMYCRAVAQTNQPLIIQECIYNADEPSSVSVVFYNGLATPDNFGDRSLLIFFYELGIGLPP